MLVNLERAHRKGMDGTGNMNNGMSWSIYDTNGREVILCIQEKEMVFMILIALSRRFYFDNEQDYVHLGPAI